MGQWAYLWNKSLNDKPSQYAALYEKNIWAQTSIIPFPKIFLFIIMYSHMYNPQHLTVPEHIDLLSKGGPVTASLDALEF